MFPVRFLVIILSSECSKFFLNCSAFLKHSVLWRRCSTCLTLCVNNMFRFPKCSQAEHRPRVTWLLVIKTLVSNESQKTAKCLVLVSDQYIFKLHIEFQLILDLVFLHVVAILNLKDNFTPKITTMIQGLAGPPPPTAGTFSNCNETRQQLNPHLLSLHYHLI